MNPGYRAPVFRRRREVCNGFFSQRRRVRARNYGDELTHIYIISIILPPEYFTDGGFKERKIFFRKTHDADIRLRIDYHSFVYAKPDKRREIYKQHIIDSIMTLQRKVSKAYLFDQLVSDVAAVLDS